MMTDDELPLARRASPLAFEELLEVLLRVQSGDRVDGGDAGGARAPTRASLSLRSSSAALSASSRRRPFRQPSRYPAPTNSPAKKSQ